MIERPLLRNTWYTAAFASSLRPGELLAQTLLGEPLVFARDAHGQPYALLDRCPHAFAPLSLGKVLPGDRIRCPYHGLEFGSDGKCVHNPHGNGNIPPSAAVRRYPVVERHTMLWCWMGEREPDASLIPDFGVLDDVADVHRSTEDVLELDVHAELIVNNLLDLSHSPYLHEGVLGNEGTIAAKITVEQSGNTVTVMREIEGAEIPGFFAPMLPTAPGELVTKTNRMRWDAPGALLNDADVGRIGDPASRTGTYGAHFITPVTAHSAIYHFVAVRKNPRPASEAQDRAIQTQISRVRRTAFETQDAAMIVAQQQRIDLALPGQLQQALLVVDQAAVRKERVMSALVAAER
jgi:phenylpropionate dioxygenase-like ring-hydroxylating dioxygenase large terminal subunit